MARYAEWTDNNANYYQHYPTKEVQDSNPKLEVVWSRPLQVTDTSQNSLMWSTGRTRYFKPVFEQTAVTMKANILQY